MIGDIDQQNFSWSYQDLAIILNFLSGTLKILTSSTDSRKQFGENNVHIPKDLGGCEWFLVIWWNMDVHYHLGEYIILIQMFVTLCVCVCFYSCLLDFCIVMKI